MINIAIVEDDNDDVERLKKCLAYVKEKIDVSYNVTVFADAEHFLFRSTFDFDLVFLDIQMAEMDGIAAAKKIRQSNKTIGIVFVTNMRQLAIKGYEVSALDFIVKPVRESDFFLKMQHILSRLDYSRKDRVVVGCGDRQTSFPVNSVRYLEVSGHYVTYHTGNSDVKEYVTLKEVENKLSAYPFFKKCSRYFVVNFNYVDEIKNNEVYIGDARLVISRSYKADFYRAFADYISGGGTK